jgi:hypothetical protein
MRKGCTQSRKQLMVNRKHEIKGLIGDVYFKMKQT